MFWTPGLLTMSSELKRKSDALLERIYHHQRKCLEHIRDIRIQRGDADAMQHREFADKESVASNMLTVELAGVHSQALVDLNSARRCGSCAWWDNACLNPEGPAAAKRVPMRFGSCSLWEYIEGYGSYREYGENG